MDGRRQHHLIVIFFSVDALSGVFAVILAAPWSLLFGDLLPGGNHGVSMAAGIAFLSAGAALNAGLAYFLSRWLLRKTLRLAPRGARPLRQRSTLRFTGHSRGRAGGL